MTETLSEEEIKDIESSFNNIIEGSKKDSFFKQNEITIDIIIRKIKNSRYSSYSLKSIAEQEYIYRNLAKYNLLKTTNNFIDIALTAHSIYQKEGIEKAKELVSAGTGILVISTLVPHALRLGGTPAIKAAFVETAIIIGNGVSEIIKKAIDEVAETSENITSYLLKKGYLTEDSICFKKLLEDILSNFSADSEKELLKKASEEFMPASIPLEDLKINSDTGINNEIKETLNNILKSQENIEEKINSDFETAEETRSPLAIDLDGDGVETVSVDNGVYFDHDGNGFAEKTGWISSDDALLVRDINENGQIDNGSELFGDQTILSNGEKAANGFEALADLDSNRDGVFDGDDEAFGEIKVWQDFNQNGVVRFYSKTGYMSVQSMKKHHRPLKSVQFQTLGRAIYIPSSFAKHNHYII